MKNKYTEFVNSFAEFEAEATKVFNRLTDKLTLQRINYTTDGIVYQYKENTAYTPSGTLTFPFNFLFKSDSELLDLYKSWSGEEEEYKEYQRLSLKYSNK